MKVWDLGALGLHLQGTLHARFIEFSFVNVGKFLQ